MWKGRRESRQFQLAREVLQWVKNGSYEEYVKGSPNLV